MNQQEQSESGTHRMPPMVLTNLTPVEIIGRDNIGIFKRFYEIASSVSNGGEFPTNRINKEIGPENRNHISEKLQELRDNGFYPDGFKSDGSICWKVVLKSPSQVEFEKGLKRLKGKTRKQLSDIAKGFRSVLKEF